MDKRVGSYTVFRATVICEGRKSKNPLSGQVKDFVHTKLQNGKIFTVQDIDTKGEIELAIPDNWFTSNLKQGCVYMFVYLKNDIESYQARDFLWCDQV